MENNHPMTTNNKKLDAVEIVVLASSIIILATATVFWYTQIYDVVSLLSSL